MNIRFEEQKEYIDWLEKYYLIHINDKKIVEEITRQKKITELFHTKDVLMLCYSEQNKDIFLKVLEKMKYETDDGIKVFDLNGMEICYLHKKTNNKFYSVLYIQNEDKTFFQEHF